KDNQLKPISGVTVKLSGGKSETAVTEADGHYTFANLTATRSYTISASRANYSFSPSEIAITSLEGDQATDDFTGTLLKYSISGQILESNGNPLGSVAVALSGLISQQK